MSMSKKDLIALADVVRRANTGNPVSIHVHAEEGNKLPIFTPTAIADLASFCASQNPRFNRERWLAYIAGECGPNGGKRGKEIRCAICNEPGNEVPYSMAGRYHMFGPLADHDFTPKR